MRSQVFFWSNNHILRRCYTTISKKKRICIIGSGPAGFYTADSLLRSKVVEVDIFDKLPIPFGLLRYGVAPDHQPIKDAGISFNQVLQNNHCRFFGNVNIGQDVTMSELLDTYHGAVLAYGAQKDRKLGIPGEESKNVLSAREFVSWYNGHPDYVNLDVNLDCETALVVGQGNVALDVARILLKDVNLLKETDIAENALEKLKKSRIKRVIVAGRRGPFQIAFKIKEFRDLTKLLNFDIILHPEDFRDIADKISVLERRHKRIMEFLYEKSQVCDHKRDKVLEFQFLKNPKAVIPDSHGRVENFVFGINKLKEEPSHEESEVIDTGEEEMLNCGLVIKSVGYHSVPIDPIIPFDKTKCIVPNNYGKVMEQEGLYCSGWIKTGPKGVLTSTLFSSNQTAEVIVHDIHSGKLETCPRDQGENFIKILKERGVKFVTKEDWKKIDELELQRGNEKGKIRNKLYSFEEMLKAANIV